MTDSSGTSAERKQEPIVVLGLGNPGRQYANNRHNFGFMVLDRFAETLKIEYRTSSGAFVYADNAYAKTDSIPKDQSVYLCKPTCFMNNSGVAARQITKNFKCEPQNLLVVYDDIDLEIGRIRLRKTGSSGGHKGLESIIYQLQTDEFPRLRLGIGPQDAGIPSEVFVLEDFRKSETVIVSEVIDISVSTIADFINIDTDTVMNRYNSLNLSKSMKKESA